MSGSGSSQHAAAPDPTRRRGRSLGWLLIAVGVVVALAGLLFVNADRGDQTAGTSVTLTAVARPGVTSAQLLGLEGELVGAEAVVDPATGRLPDVEAFHAAGVQSMSIDEGVLVVVMLPTASPGERDRVRSRLQASPLVQRVEESTG